MEITLKPVAFVESAVFERKDIGWGEDVSTIRLEPEYIGGLSGLSAFSHAIIVTFLDKATLTGKSICRGGLKTARTCLLPASSPSGARTGPTGSA